MLRLADLHHVAAGATLDHVRHRRSHRASIATARRAPRGIDGAPPLDATHGATLDQTLRTHVTAAGATDGDFEFLTGQLARLIIESDNPFTPRQKTVQLKMIAALVAFRNVQRVVGGGTLVSLALVDPATMP